jgi:hypothetical protein
MTCTAMSGSGAWIIGTTAIREHQRMGALGLTKMPVRIKIVRAGCCAVALGTSSPGTAARLSATGTTRTTATTTLGSASVASPRTNSLSLNSLDLYTWLLVVGCQPGWGVEWCKPWRRRRLDFSTSRAVNGAMRHEPSKRGLTEA